MRSGGGEGDEKRLRWIRCFLLRLLLRDSSSAKECSTVRSFAD